MPLIVLAGEEDFELGKRVKKLTKSLVDEAWASFNLSKSDNPSIVDIADSALALPFGQGNKVIVFENCTLFTKKRVPGKASQKLSATKAKKQLENLSENLANINPNTYIILVSTHNFDSSLKISKIVAEHAKIEKFPKPRFFIGSNNPELETWVQKEAKSFGATIDEEAATYLLDGTEANLRQISKELEKTATFILPKTHITLETVQNLSPYHSHVFSLLDFWLQGKSKEVLTSVNELLSRQPAIQIMATLQTFLSRWIEMKTICHEANSKLPYGAGVNKRELPLKEQVKNVSYKLKMKPFVVEKDLKRLKNWPLKKLVAAKETLTRLESSVKSGQINDHSALTLFLIN